MGINDAPGSNPTSVPRYDANTQYFDLPGLINIQSNYLTDLSKNYYNNAIDVAVDVNSLQKNLIDVSNSYALADQSSTAILTDQSNVMQIINSEQDRLNQKQELIKQMEQENKRKVLLNDTYRKKKVQYSKIMIVIIIALVIVIVISFIGKLLPIPEGFLSFLYILDIAIALIVCFNLYSDATMRDYINYDEIYIPPPTIDGSGNVISNNKDVPSFWSTMKFGCYEAACCADGTVYDEKLKVCVIPNNKVKSPSPITPAPIIEAAPALAPALAPSKAPSNAPSNAPAQAFTTIDQAIQFGDLNQNYKILSDSELKKAYKFEKSDPKPHMDLEFTEYKYKI
jgi:hypothetical protein